MKDSLLTFDRTCHVLYSKPCKKLIRQCIARHYPPERREEIWESVQLQYAQFLKDWRTDLGGKKNFHNGRGGTYDCIALMSCYVVCKDAVTLAEIEEMARCSCPRSGCCDLSTSTGPSGKSCSTARS